MKMKSITLSLVCILLLVSGVALYGQEERKVKMDEYKAELADYQTREATATERIATLDAEIAELKAEIDKVQGQIDATWDEMYTMAGTDKAGAEQYSNNLAGIDAELDGLAALSAEDLFRNRENLEDAVKRIEEAKGSKLAVFTENEGKLAALDAKVAALNAKMPANIYDQYTVMKGDFLWKISKMEDIYGDPYQWIRIYCVNKDQIKDPDLIFPEQVFNIARGVGKNEHLVVKGEYLSSIAGMAKIFNDPTKWTKLYEANKDIISDPSLIYPYQVITIPKE